MRPELELAENEIRCAWHQYQRVEKYGLAFGRVLFECQQKFSKQGSRTGLGLRPMLDKVGIPHSTAYWWISRYKDYAGLKDPPPKHAPGPLPKGIYSVIYADPPWQYDLPHIYEYGPAERHYPTLSFQEICDFKLPAIAPNAAAFLWSTSCMLEKAFKVIDAWKFRYTGASFVWDKILHNYGRYNSVRHELLLLATRGSCLPEGRHVDSTGVERTHLFDSVQSVERTEHSRKPERFREMIDTMYPTGPRIELFARGPLPAHWEGWGDEHVPPKAVAAD